MSGKAESVKDLDTFRIGTLLNPREAYAYLGQTARVFCKGKSCRDTQLLFPIARPQVHSRAYLRSWPKDACRQMRLRVVASGRVEK